MQDGLQATNYRIYGCENKRGWIKITEVEKKEHIKPVLKDMAESDLFIGYIVIKHNFEKNQDEPFGLGDFYKKEKVYKKR